MIVCSNEEENKSHILSRLHSYRRAVNPELEIDNCKCYLQKHFTSPVSMDSENQVISTPDLYASAVDSEK